MSRAAVKAIVAMLIAGGAAAGCGGALGAPDGGQGAIDAPACRCSVEGGVLTMSWECFCSSYDCWDDAYMCETAPRTSYPACGLTVATFGGIGGPEHWVYDQSGLLVGRQLAGDAAWFTCPTDPSVKALQVRAGRFPDASCGGGTACGCETGAATCEVPNGGTCACSLAADQNGPPTLTLSWDCYCAKFGCSWQLGAPNPANCQSLRRVDYPECGLTQLTPIGFGGQFEAIFDPSGRLVGGTTISDTTPYTCPSDPATRANHVRAGQFPDPSCRAVECEPCYAGTFPCTARDGSAGG